MPSKSQVMRDALPEGFKEALAGRPYLERNRLSSWGIDISTKGIDIHRISSHGSKNSHYRQSIPTDTKPELVHQLARAYAAAFQLATTVGWAHTPGVIAMELPFGPGAQKWLPWFGAYAAGVSAALGHLFGAVPPFFEVQQNEWKKQVGLKGNCEKRAVADLYASAAVADVVQMQHDTFTQDEADSYFIALYARAQLEK